jgi:choline dehydrogenase-like flavoprotein
MGAHSGGREYDSIVVGSGMGGAVVARELANAGRDVLVVEVGQPPGHLGAFGDALRMYDGNPVTKLPKRSAEGTIIYRALVAGGSTVVSCGNGVRCLERELAELGVDLADDLAAIESEMGIAPLGEDKLSDLGERIRQAGEELGHPFALMPKMIDQARCEACGSCVLGCPHDAKWTSLRALDEAVSHGAEVAYGVEVERVLHDGGAAVGVTGHGEDGAFEARAGTIVLSAGGLGTPVILRASGIEQAGTGLFIDTFVNVYGTTDETVKTVEPTMSIVNTEFHDDRGFLMSPFINYSRSTRMIEGGAGLAARSLRHIFGMMVKTSDDAVGEVHADGTVSKPVTGADRRRLDDGASVAGEVLVAAGVSRDSLIVSKPQGAHPGGTAAIGSIVDTDLQTEVDGLFVADASVLPTTPGMPPLVTIGALARRLGRTLAAAI